MVDKERVLLICTDGMLYSLGKKDGNCLWKFRADTGFRNNVSSPPFVHKGHVYVIDEGGTMYSLDLQSGKELWKFCTLSTGVFKFKYSQDGLIYILSKEGIWVLNKDGILLKEFRLEGLDIKEGILDLLLGEVIYLLSTKGIYRIKINLAG
jgi:hypothetical protein